ALWFARGLSPRASGLFQSELLAADLIITWIAGPMLLLTLQTGPWTVLVSAGPLFLARPALSTLLARRQTPERPAAARAACAVDDRSAARRPALCGRRAAGCP